MRPELGILADDLTGATDTGLQFAKCGRRTCVCLSWPSVPSCDVLVVDVDSRNRLADEARRRAVSATVSLRAAGVTRLYKKVDSTGRGNLGAEIDGALEAAELRAAVLCPAFPQLGRTVRGGRIFVRGLPLDQTEFALDPLWPALTSSIAEILGRRASAPVTQVGLADLRKGPVALRARVSDAIRQGARVVVVDSETSGDLRCLAESLRLAPEPVLPVGSAGLAEWLIGPLPRPARAPKPLTLSGGPVLIVAGTMNRVGIGQLTRLIERGAHVLRLDLERALDEPKVAIAEVSGQLARLPPEVNSVVLALADPRELPIELSVAARQRQLDPLAATERLMGALARAATAVMELVAPAALILTGGDTARAVCAALKIQALEISREAAPGVPICRFQGGAWDGLTVVTKAGGFGDVETLVNVVDVLGRMRA